MSRLRGKLSYANVMATVAVFIALGGSAYAATELKPNSVGTKQLKNGAVTGEKLQDGSITGSKLNLSSLGTVPNASHASSADSATHAETATTASSANTASHAESATSASSAANADQLGGSPPSAYRDSCPTGTQLRTPELCEETRVEGHVTFTEALKNCAAAGLRLPSPSEAETLETGIYSVWVDDFWTNGATSYALVYLAPSHDLSEYESGLEANSVCVTTPVDN